MIPTMLPTRLSLALVLSLVAGTAAALEPFVVKDISVRGLQRTEAGTVFSYLPVKVGDLLTEDRATQAIKALYATGFFRDVKLGVKDDVLYVTLEERPSISTIKLVGIKDFPEEELKKALGQNGLAEGRVLDRSVLDRAEQELKRQYFNRGKYAVDIKITTTPEARNRVAVQFDVSEGDAAKIQRISVVGNEAFSEKELLKQISSTTPGWLTWYTKSDQYSKSKLAGDIEALRSFYLNRGYLEFAVDSTQVTISPDKSGIYITLNVTEGKQFKVSDVKLAGQLLVPEPELKKLVSLKMGEVFARDRVTESTKAITDRLGNDGYAFANVNAVPELDHARNEVAFTLFVDPGRRVYVNRVNVAGNAKTRDEVVRREVRQMEGAYYNADKINLSRDRLNRLGYFSNVNLETPGVPGTTDQVDLNVSVEERSTGNIQLGAGFSSSEGFVLSGSVSQSNVFGTGNRVSAQINSGSVNTVYALSFTNPYATIDGVSLGYDLYRRDLDATSLSSVGDYETSTYGAGVRFGLPISERDFLSFGLTYENTSITTTATSPQRYLDYVNTFGPDNDTIKLDAGFARDTRNSFLFPTAGLFQRAAVEVGTPLGSLEYYKITLQHQQYFPIGKSFALMLNGEAGYGGGLSGKPLPFFKNFYAGGNGSVRGFESATLGPKDALGDAIGGDTRLVGNAELFFPVPGMKDDKSMRLSLFFDAGATFGPGDANGDYQTFAFDDLRYSAGLAVLWVSPLGPLKFSLAQPLRSQPGDQEEIFQFSLGNAF